MNQWYFILGLVGSIALLTIGMFLCIILIIKRYIKRQPRKSIVISLIVDTVLAVLMSVYLCSHSTYYKYNDWLMLQSNIYMIEQKYGEFDLGQIKDNEKGRVAYYIYTDNGPVMPDHLEHYYYMEYDEWGVVYKVYDGCQLGG